MSCPNSTSPIDINMSSISGKCDLKCDYSFKYQPSSCSVTNRGDYLSFSYDNTSSPPVLYNMNKYDVQEVRLYTPSLHSYANTKTDAELIIIHNSTSGSKPLLVCIPVKSSNSTSISAQLFSQIIKTVSKSAPTNGSSTSVNTKLYNLSSLVPRKPYYSYSATEPYQPCMTQVDLVVYDPLNANLDIGSDILNVLKQVISSNVYDVKKGTAKLFFNEQGPSRFGSGNDEIYIDCQPVGISEEEVVTIEDFGSTQTDLKSILSNPLVQLVLGSAIFIILLLLLQFIIGLLSKKSSSANLSFTPFNIPKNIYAKSS